MPNSFLNELSERMSTPVFNDASAVKREVYRLLSEKKYSVEMKTRVEDTPVRRFNNKIIPKSEIIEVQFNLDHPEELYKPEGAISNFCLLFRRREGIYEIVFYYPGYACDPIITCDLSSHKEVKNMIERISDIYGYA
jgi:hypothetical protein